MTSVPGQHLSPYGEGPRFLLSMQLYQGGIMASVFDVAYYILRKEGQMTAMKLQKLVYYAQAWSTVWDETPMFLERVEAWMNGPVVPSLYRMHRGKFMVDVTAFAGLGNDRMLTPKQKDIIGAVLTVYGKRSPNYLSELTHKERPWLEARQGLSRGARGTKTITTEAMADFYGSLYNN